MADMAYLDDTIAVTASLDPEGQVAVQGFEWQGKRQTVTAVGRQWETEEGRHILVEVGNGDRFELLLSREDLLWHLKRAWQETLLA